MNVYVFYFKLGFISIGTQGNNYFIKILKRNIQSKELNIILNFFNYKLKLLKYILF